MDSETGVGYAPWNRPWYVQAAGVIIGSAVVGPPRGPTGPPWGRAPPYENPGCAPGAKYEVIAAEHDSDICFSQTVLNFMKN